MKPHQYNPKLGFEFRKCERCHRLRWCCQHHLNVGRYTDDSVWICSNNGQGILYTDSCHDFLHNHPLIARQEGFMRVMDSIYRPKKSSPKKWKLKKKCATF